MSVYTYDKINKKWIKTEISISEILLVAKGFLKLLANKLSITK